MDPKIITLITIALQTFAAYQAIHLTRSNHSRHGWILSFVQVLLVVLWVCDFVGLHHGDERAGTVILTSIRVGIAALSVIGLHLHRSYLEKTQAEWRREYGK